MSSINLEELRALPDYAQMTKWGIKFVTLPAVGALGFPLSDSLDLRCESVTLPKVTNQKFEVQTRGHKTLHSGIADYGNTLTMVFNETVDNKILTFIKAWRELCWSARTGKAFNKQDIEATLLITLYDNQNKARAKYTVYGCFYEDSDEVSLDGASSESIKMGLTISFDYFVESPLNV